MWLPRSAVQRLILGLANDFSESCLASAEGSVISNQTVHDSTGGRMPGTKHHSVCTSRR